MTGVNFSLDGEVALGHWRSECVSELSSRRRGDASQRPRINSQHQLDVGDDRQPRPPAGALQLREGGC
jgi:hypothetical protein